MSKFNLGDVVSSKTDAHHKLVILKVKKRFFDRPQKYKVRWFDQQMVGQGSFSAGYETGTAFEHEIE